MRGPAGLPLPLVVAVALAAAAVMVVEARFVVEKNSLMVTSPTSLRGRHDSAIGNFGVPQYGGSMAGTVVYPKDNADACEAYDGDRHFRAKPGALPNFLLIDRGSECRLLPAPIPLWLREFALLRGWIWCR
jgi:hypothetical protein